MFNKSLFAVLILALSFLAKGANAADVKILCASGMREIVSELQPAFEHVVGRVNIDFGEAGDLRKRLQGGEAADRQRSRFAFCAIVVLATV